MLTLPSVFSDHALYQHSAPLSIVGVAEAGEKLSLSLLLNGKAVTETEAVADEKGNFTLSITTPAASFESYDIVIKGKDEEKKISDVLFGELWLASGQSNMEMCNIQQIEWNDYYNNLIGKNMRFFKQGRNPVGHTYEFPFEPDPSVGGRWLTMDEKDQLGYVSACATAFSNKIYEFLNSGKAENTPVGFLNSSVGGTLIEPWLPREAYEGNEELTAYLKEIGRYPDKETWNKKGDGNYQQTSSHFNFLIYPHRGLRFRGIIWYQGESNSSAEYKFKIYAKLLKALRESYKKMFAISEDSVFPIISSMIYPWAYGKSCETSVGYLNNAFTELAKESPAEYPFIPICDLSPIWGFHINNHPIHPIHKFPLGERMALLTENAVYGRKVRNVQKVPAMLKTCKRSGNKLRLTFSDVGDGLYIGGKKIKGLYIAGKDGNYTPAECEIVNKSTMLVWHPFIEKPEHIAYAFSSYEAKTNLYAGEFPVAPFCTQTEKGDPYVWIGIKPWLDLTLDSEFTDYFTDTARNCFRKPIYLPSENSTVCFDPDFSLSGRAIRVEGNDSVFGTYVLARPYCPLDLQNYKALRVSLLNQKGLKAEMKLYFAENEGSSVTVRLEATKLCDLAGGFGQYEYDFSALPAGTVTKMEFVFSQTDNTLHFVNLDNPVLVK